MSTPATGATELAFRISVVPFSPLLPRVEMKVVRPGSCRERGFLCGAAAHRVPAFFAPPPEDWEVISVDSSLLEDQLLDQLAVVVPGMRFPLWIRGVRPRRPSRASRRRVASPRSPFPPPRCRIASPCKWSAACRATTAA